MNFNLNDRVRVLQPTSAKYSTGFQGTVVADNPGTYTVRDLGGWDHVAPAGNLVKISWWEAVTAPRLAQ